MESNTVTRAREAWGKGSKYDGRGVRGRSGRGAEAVRGAGGEKAVE